MNSLAGEFAGTLLHAVLNAHILHFQTQSYAAHKALGHFYEELQDLVDTYVEAFQGLYGLIETYPSSVHQGPASDPIEHVKNVGVYVRDMRKHLPDETELQNIIDDVMQLVDSTLYKLRFLK